MKKTICASIVLLALAALPLSHLLMADHGKVYLCHVTVRTFLFDRGHKIHVKHAAEAAHLRHGDCPTNPGKASTGCRCPDKPQS